MRDVPISLCTWSRSRATSHREDVVYLAVGQSLHGPLGVRPFLCVLWGSILKTTLVGFGKLHLGAADSGLRDATDDAVG